MSNSIVSIICVLLLAIYVFCALRESNVTGMYHRVFNRLTAYLFSNFIVAGVSAFFMPFFMREYNVFLCLLLGLVLLACAVGLYLLSSRKCPEPLKAKLLLSMLIVGNGVTVKVVFFFIKGIWAYTDASMGADNARAAQIPCGVYDPRTGESYSVSEGSDGAFFVNIDGHQRELRKSGNTYIDSDGNQYS